MLRPSGPGCIKENGLASGVLRGVAREYDAVARPWGEVDDTRRAGVDVDVRRRVLKTPALRHE